MKEYEEKEKWRYALLNQIIANRLKTRTFADAEKALMSCGFVKKEERESARELLAV